MDTLFYFPPSFCQQPAYAARPSDVFVYPHQPDSSQQDCYDMPRPLHQVLTRQDSSNYQAPRPHRPPPSPMVKHQTSVPDAFADYDVPRQHHASNRVQQTRTPPIDSRCGNIYIWVVESFETNAILNGLCPSFSHYETHCLAE